MFQKWIIAKLIITQRSNYLNGSNGQKKSRCFFFFYLYHKASPFVNQKTPWEQTYARISTKLFKFFLIKLASNCVLISQARFLSIYNGRIRQYNKWGNYGVTVEKIFYLNSLLRNIFQLSFCLVFLLLINILK